MFPCFLGGVWTIFNSREAPSRWQPRVCDGGMTGVDEAALGRDVEVDEGVLVVPLQLQPQRLDVLPVLGGLRELLAVDLEARRRRSPATTIWAVGQATLTSQPMSLDPMTQYARRRCPCG